MGYDKAFEVNRLVNAKRVYHYADMPAGHTPKVMREGESGNCADFAVTKGHLLKEAGFSRALLSMVQFVHWTGRGIRCA